MALAKLVQAGIPNHVCRKKKNGQQQQQMNPHTGYVEH